jgi:hypothetical protein
MGLNRVGRWPFDSGPGYRHCNHLKSASSARFARVLPQLPTCRRLASESRSPNHHPAHELAISSMEAYCNHLRGNRTELRRLAAFDLVRIWHGQWFGIGTGTLSRAFHRPAAGSCRPLSTQTRVGVLHGSRYRGPTNILTFRVKIEWLESKT